MGGIPVVVAVQEKELAPTAPVKRSRRQIWSVISRRLKRQSASYLDYGQYYDFLDEAGRVRLGYCQVCWHVFEKDGVRELRSILRVTDPTVPYEYL